MTAGLKLAVVVVVAALSACGDSGATTQAPSTSTTLTTASTTTSAPGPTLPPGDDTILTRVVDGDTIDVAPGLTVRLIGIDTPETVDPRRAPRCFGAEATRRTSELLAPGTPLRLVYDLERRDRFGGPWPTSTAEATGSSSTPPW